MSIKHRAYHLLRAVASRRRREMIKRRASQARTKLAPLLRAVHGTYDIDELECLLRAAMPDDFEIMMVHSSISNMQPMYTGGPLDIVNLLRKLAGPDRTLAMPAFFFGNSKLFDRNYYREHPRFDVRRTPSKMGLVTELFRRQPGVARSLHPTHSVCAAGPLAEELCGSHHLSPLTFGPQSPFGIMAQRSTVIIGLGVEYYRSLTQVHSAEDVMDAFPVPRDTAEPTFVNLVDKTGVVHPYWMAQPLSPEYVFRAERLLAFVSDGDIRKWKFKGTAFYLTTAARINSAVREAAVRGLTLYDHLPSATPGGTHR